MKQYIIDRFEGDYAVCEDENNFFVDIKRALLPSEIKVGDVLIYEKKQFYIDANMTHRRRQVISDLQDELFE